MRGVCATTARATAAATRVGALGGAPAWVEGAARAVVGLDAGSGARTLSAAARKSTIGFALDIDGVLSRGVTAVEGSPQALAKLDRAGVPYVLMTNSGGIKEEAKAEKLRSILGVDVQARDVVVAHTPLRRREDLKDRHVLLSGKANALGVMESYGFTRVSTVRGLHEEYPELFPDRAPADVADSGPAVWRAGEPIEAIVVCMDPFDWARDLQILTDVLRSSGQPWRHHDGRYELRPHVDDQLPLITTTPDLSYSADWEVERFGCGVFATALAAIYEASEHLPLRWEAYGKPNHQTYDYTEALLRDRAAAANAELDVIYGVGDNPTTDIDGANSAGGIWRSVLVETGVYRGGDHHAHSKYSDFAAAVDALLAHHGIAH